jgi:hypothetical protein
MHNTNQTNVENNHSDDSTPIQPEVALPDECDSNHTAPQVLQRIQPRDDRLDQSGTTVAVPTASANNRWFGMDEAVVGLAHRAKNLPCQDAAISQHSENPFIILADGAGSAAVSDIGAQAVVTGIARLLQTMEALWLPLLDSEEPSDQALLSKWPLLLVAHARGILDDTAKTHRRDIRDFRCTLLGVLAGRKRMLWFKVGDGEVVIERIQWDGTQNPVRQCCVLGERGKGDFVNQTTFIDVAKSTDVQWGVESLSDICGLVVMSDGAAERLVSADGLNVSARVGELLGELRNQQLKRQRLTKMFYSPEFCDRTSGDDRSISLLARHIETPLTPATQPLKTEASTHSVEFVAPEVSPRRAQRVKSKRK